MTYTGCLCDDDCHSNTRGIFAQGHDQKLRAKLESKIGGLLRLKALVDEAQAFAAGERSLQQYGAATSALLAKDQGSTPSDGLP